MTELNPAYIVLMLAVPIWGAAMLVRWSLRCWGNWLSPLLVWQRVSVVAIFSAMVLYGGSKAVVPQSIKELLVVLADGSLKDLSGRVASGVQARAVGEYIEQSDRIVTAADGVIEQARLDCIALTNQLASMDYSVAYISLDLPRGTPAEANHNIMVSFERVAQTTSNLTAYVWFSEAPVTNVNVHVDYSLAAGQWTGLKAVTNSYPQTYTVGSVQCYQYVYEIPAGIAGTPLKPQYEVEFGGYDVGQWLSVPESGVVVEVAEEEYLPFTGWDDYSTGTNSVLVRYVGGIAVEAIVNGESIKGGA